jgi:predicted dehydrogenase
MRQQNPITRRRFLNRGVSAATGTVALTVPARRVSGANDRIALAVIGIRNRGREHIDQWSKIPGVHIATLCDIDERLFPAGSGQVEKLQGHRPKTETDLRKVFDDKDIDIVAVAAPNHWHALVAVWAIQAGKDVYVEKPVSHSIREGRAILEAARKYGRIVQTGSQHRSNPMVRSAMECIRGGLIGKPYMVKCVVYRPRESIGRGRAADVPAGVHFDLWLGPAPARPFIDNRFHYNWHWFWDTGNGETGNNGPHVTDIARWALGKEDHPVRVQSTGGFFGYDSDQETPNIQTSCLSYSDGSLVQLECRGLATPTDGSVREGVIVFGEKGWVEISLTDRSWSSTLAPENHPGPGMTSEETRTQYDELNAGGAKADPHFVNFIDCVRSRKAENLAADISCGHRAAVMCHLANIACRTGRTLSFESKAERFPDDPQAQALAEGTYRKPFAMPEKI